MSWSRISQRTSNTRPDRVSGSYEPSSLPGLLGYWDARDTSVGSVTSWPARAGSLGALTGTGTSDGLKITAPRYGTASNVPNPGSSSWGMWGIFTVNSLGSDVSSRNLIHLQNATGGGQGYGLLWYNYSGNVLKILPLPTTVAGGISQLSTGKDYLLILNVTGTNAATAYTTSQDGSSTTTGSPSLDSTAKVWVGKNYNNQSNVVLDGHVRACGITSTPLSLGSIAMLRAWAKSSFSVPD